MYVDFAGSILRSKVVNGLLEPALFAIDQRAQRAVGAFVDAQGRPFCTGTLVSKHVVLSAAHCGVDVGDTFAIGADLSTPEATATVVQVERRSTWTGVGTAHDQLLALLDRDLDVQPLGLASRALVVGESVQGVGYGLVAPDSSPNNLRWWVVEPVTAVSDTWFSVDGFGQRGLCNGDSGGPALILEPGETIPAIAGTVSQGAVSCVGEDLYSIVDREWVAQVLSKWPAHGRTTLQRVQTAAVPIALGLVLLGVGVGLVVRSRKRASARPQL